MFIGVPKEIKADEYRVGLIPSTISELVAQGHDVAVETCAGQGAGIVDDEYTAAGASIVATADEIFKQSELIVKVKEPLTSERMKLRRGQIIFTYLHLASDPEQTHDLMNSGVTAIAYETVTDAAGKLPLLAPMSKVAGRMAPQVAAHYLERPYGGRGILLSGVDDVPSAKVVVIGGGVVGQNAAEIAIGMGAEVTVVARSAETRTFSFAIVSGAHLHRGGWPRHYRSALQIGRRRDCGSLGRWRHGTQAHLRRHGRGDEARRSHRRCLN